MRLGFMGAVVVVRMLFPPRRCLCLSLLRRRRLFSVITTTSSLSSVEEEERRNNRSTLLRETKSDLIQRIYDLRIENRTSQSQISRLTSLDLMMDNRRVLWERGPKTLDPKLEIHTDLLYQIDRAQMQYGSTFYFSRTNGVDDPMSALIDLGVLYLEDKGFPEVWTRASQAEEGDFELSDFRVIGKGVDRAIPRSVIPSYQLREGICPSRLPKRYAELSSRLCCDAVMELGASHGNLPYAFKFITQKFEHVCITGPNRDESSEMFEEMLKNCEEFYMALGIPYRVVAIETDLFVRDGTTKYLLEGWFPGSRTYKGLATCQRYTDCLILKCKSGERNKHPGQPVHLLRSALMVTETTLAALLENYQKEDGVEFPELLRSYMGGKSFLPFCQNAIAGENKAFEEWVENSMR